MMCFDNCPHNEGNKCTFNNDYCEVELIGEVECFQKEIDLLETKLERLERGLFRAESKYKNVFSDL